MYNFTRGEFPFAPMTEEYLLHRDPTYDIVKHCVRYIYDVPGLDQIISEDEPRPNAYLPETTKSVTRQVRTEYYASAVEKEPNMAAESWENSPLFRETPEYETVYPLDTTLNQKMGLKHQVKASKIVTSEEMHLLALPQSPRIEFPPYADDRLYLPDGGVVEYVLTGERYFEGTKTNLSKDAWLKYTLDELLSCCRTITDLIFLKYNHDYYMEFDCTLEPAAAPPLPTNYTVAYFSYEILKCLDRPLYNSEPEVACRQYAATLTQSRTETESLFGDKCARIYKKVLRDYAQAYEHAGCQQSYVWRNIRDALKQNY